MINPRPLFPLWPHFLPDGRHFLFTALGEADKDNDLYVGSLDSGESRLLVKDASRATYAPPGYLLYVRDGTLLAQPFDGRALRLTGDPMPIADQLLYFWPTGAADFSVSENGVLAYRAGASITRLAWFDRRGAEVGSVGAPNDYQLPRISPDGQSAAVGVIDPHTGTSDIWIYDLSRGAFTRFTSEPGGEESPVWSSDGRQIVFAADPDGPPHLHQKALHETRSGAVLLPLSGWVQSSYDWTRDGRFILYGDGAAKTGEDLMLLPMFGERKPTPFLRTRFNEVDARFSPDGRWIAYVSDESGRSEVYVRSFQGAARARARARR